MRQPPPKPRLTYPGPPKQYRRPLLTATPHPRGPHRPPTAAPLLPSDRLQTDHPDRAAGPTGPGRRDQFAFGLFDYGHPTTLMIKLQEQRVDFGLICTPAELLPLGRVIRRGLPGWRPRHRRRTTAATAPSAAGRLDYSQPAAGQRPASLGPVVRPGRPAQHPPGSVLPAPTVRWTNRLSCASCCANRAPPGCKGSIRSSTIAPAGSPACSMAFQTGVALPALRPGRPEAARAAGARRAALRAADHHHPARPRSHRPSRAARATSVTPSGDVSTSVGAAWSWTSGGPGSDRS